MKFRTGNKSVRDHSVQGKALYLFAQLKKGFVRFEGIFALAGYVNRQADDKDGIARQIIVFHLVPVSDHDEGYPFNRDENDGAVVDYSTVDLVELRRSAYIATSDVAHSDPKQSMRRYYNRSRIVRKYVLVRSGGRCEACKKPAPFTRTDGTFYLEPHHTRLISESGLDHPSLGECHLSKLPS
jgi:5-methylcytosine-specific restriction protein A